MMERNGDIVLQLGQGILGEDQRVWWTSGVGRGYVGRLERLE